MSALDIVCDIPSISTTAVRKHISAKLPSGTYLQDCRQKRTVFVGEDMLASMFAQAPVPQPPVTAPPSASDDGRPAELGPDEKRRKQEDCLKQRRGIRHDKFAECVVVQVDHQQAISYNEPRHTQTLQALCGRYYKVGMLDGHPVYRQERCVPIMGDNKTRLEN